MAGPFHDPPYSPLHCSGLGSVEKSEGSRRMIMHLSAPQGRSVNDSIDRSAFTLSYITLDDAAALVARHGKGALELMSKVDLKSAFRLIPVRPNDLALLGCFWQASYYVDLQLPFGLRSAPAFSIGSLTRWSTSWYTTTVLRTYSITWMTSSPVDHRQPIHRAPPQQSKSAPS